MPCHEVSPLFRVYGGRFSPLSRSLRRLVAVLDDLYQCWPPFSAVFCSISRPELFLPSVTFLCEDLFFFGRCPFTSRYGRTPGGSSYSTSSSGLRPPHFFSFTGSSFGRWIDVLLVRFCVFFFPFRVAYSRRDLASPREYALDAVLFSVCLPDFSTHFGER